MKNPEFGSRICNVQGAVPKSNIPDNEVCTQIADVFFKLVQAHKAYGEAAEGIAELASHVTPEQYTMLLVASAIFWVVHV